MSVAEPTTLGLIAPHGGSLVNLMLPAAEQQAVKASASRMLLGGGQHQEIGRAHV